MPLRKLAAIGLALAGSGLLAAAPAIAAASKGVVNGVSVRPTLLTTAEDGASVRYRVSLDFAPDPGEVVTVTPSSSDVTEGTVSAPLVFTDANWNVPQYVTVTPGASGDGNDGDVAYTIFNSVNSTGGVFGAGGAPAVDVANFNIEGVANIIVDRSSALEVSEDGTVTEAVTIAAGPDVTPSADVTVALTNLSPSLVNLSTSSVTLTAGNSYSAQVFVYGIEDDVFDGEQTFAVRTEAATSADFAYNGVNPPDFSGFISDSNVRINGTLTGLAGGSSVTLSADFDLGTACFGGGANACAKVAGPAHEDLLLNADGAFSFATALRAGNTFTVDVGTQPTSPTQTCTLVPPVNKAVSGTIGNTDYNGIVVECVTSSFTVGGSVSGLAAGNSVTLRINGSEDLVVSADGAFTFVNPITDGTTYDAGVIVNPTSPNQVCTTSNGSGTINGANVTDIAVNCVTTAYAIGGNVTGLDGGSVVLQLVGGFSFAPTGVGESLTVSANGAFTFLTGIPDGTAYTVSVLTQPTVPAPGQNCVVGSGNGTMAGANVTNVQVTCSNLASVPGAPRNVVASFGAGGVVVSWDPPADDGGSPITGYTVTLQPGGASCTVTGTPAPTTCTIPGVAPGSYSVQVVASNAAGAGGAGAGGLNPAITAPEVIPASSIGSLALLAALSMLIAGLALRRSHA